MYILIVYLNEISCVCSCRWMLKCDVLAGDFHLLAENTWVSYSSGYHSGKTRILVNSLLQFCQYSWLIHVLFFPGAQSNPGIIKTAKSWSC